MAKGCPFCGSHELKFNFKVGPDTMRVLRVNVAIAKWGLCQNLRQRKSGKNYGKQELIV